MRTYVIGEVVNERGDVRPIDRVEATSGREAILKVALANPLAEEIRRVRPERLVAWPESEYAVADTAWLEARGYRSQRKPPAPWWKQLWQRLRLFFSRRGVA